MCLSFPSTRCHLSCGDWVNDKTDDYQNSVLCVYDGCMQSVCTHKWVVLTGVLEPAGSGILLVTGAQDGLQFCRPQTSWDACRCPRITPIFATPSCLPPVAVCPFRPPRQATACWFRFSLGYLVYFCMFFLIKLFICFVVFCVFLCIFSYLFLVCHCQCK